MLLKLLKRDLRLHWDALVVPLLILGLVMGGIGVVNQGVAAAGLFFIGFLFIPFLPMAIHVREVSQGTLGDLASMPVSRTALVSLRYLEVLFLAGAALTLVHLGVWLVMSVAARKPVPLNLEAGPEALAISMLILLFFAFPMPFALRWEGKGILAAFAIFLLLNLGLTGLSLRYPTKMEPLGKAFYQSAMHLVAHPGQMVLMILGLFFLSYVLSLKAFAGRDF